MNRQAIVEVFENKLQTLGRVIVDDLNQKYEAKPYLYLAVLGSRINSEVERLSFVYSVEIVYVPNVSVGDTLRLYEKADKLTEMLIETQFEDFYVNNLEVFVDALGNQTIFCMFDVVCFC